MKNTPIIVNRCGNGFMCSPPMNDPMQASSDDIMVFGDIANDPGEAAKFIAHICHATKQQQRPPAISRPELQAVRNDLGAEPAGPMGELPLP